MPHRIVPFFGAKIEIVDSERLLKNGRVRATRNGHLHSIRMTHVMAPHDAGAVCEPVAVFVVSRAQQDDRRVYGAALNNDDAATKYFMSTLSADDYFGQ